VNGCGYWCHVFREYGASDEGRVADLVLCNTGEVRCDDVFGATEDRSGYVMDSSNGGMIHEACEERFESC
jgi:hypothetical protein